MRSSILKSAAEPARAIVSDRIALTGFIVLAAIVAMALFAPLLATHDPLHINELEEGTLMQRTQAEDGSVRWVLSEPLGDVTVYDAAWQDGVGIAVARGGNVYRYDGQWAALDAPFTESLRAVAVSAAGRALIVGEGGIMALYDDTTGGWQQVDAPESVDLHAVAWSDDDTAWVVGEEETIWRLDLSTDAVSIETLQSPVNRGLDLNGIAFDADGSGLVIGERGVVLQFDPDNDSFSLLRLPTNRTLNDIHLTADGTGLIVGERGTLLAREGADADWVVEDAPDSRAIRAGWIGSEGEAIAVARNGIIMERHGDGWHLASTQGARHLRTLMVTEDHFYALGSDRFVNRLSPPTSEHWFGTDHLGRDLYSQNVYGSRIALLVGFLGAALVVLIGANVGLIAGYFRGRTETVLMRTVDVMYGIPFEPFALILVLLFEPSLLIVILAVSLLTWRTVARLIRSQVLSLRERPFVKAARVAGASDLRIMYIHIFPNVMPLVFLELAIIVGVSIIAEATLSFLGLGPPQSISWGGILHNARLSGAWRDAWWWNLPPGIFIMITVLSVFFISRSLELVANPRLRARR
ncbi:ABC transporter permease subunit [Natronospirillum operosum]|uniref:ABC transporter permease subunit n=1 Tax=Natronospirillum operosum TaxID=2759953 RepID=A0A4Z0WHC2_9GAMM|nr:ABC transporter permease subunit [Natronospirillum operosum]TGG95337.1 ABC transporter permease subunit [Natronospirillum operosum]